MALYVQSISGYGPCVSHGFIFNRKCHLVKGVLQTPPLCHSLSASPHPPCAVYTPLWYICPAILLINKHRRWHRPSPLASLSYSEASGVQQDKEETHLISWARRCIGAITQHNEGNVQHVNSAWGCSKLPGAQNSLLFSAWPA